jgi:hypothetical protein
VLAAAAVSVLVLFVAYTKVNNIEIPYVFWFAVAMVIYLRFVQRPTTRDAFLFAAAGGLSIGSKDQAYALFVCTPLVLLYVVGADRRRAGDRHPWLRALIDRRLAAAGLGAAVALSIANNVFFNWEGMMTRIGFLRTDARMVKDFDMFAAMPARRFEVFLLTARLLTQSWGWPLMIVGVLGWGAAIVTPPLRRSSAALTVVAMSSYLFFINLVMYCYDRFLLPICLIQALFAGWCLDRWLSLRSIPLAVRQAGVALVFAYSLLYAGMYDALMLRDSRHFVDRWMSEHVPPGTLVGVNFVERLRPALTPFRVREFETIGQVRDNQPAYYVLNADYARAARPDEELGQMLAALQDGSLGYSPVLDYRAPTPWGWLPGAHPQLAGPRLQDGASSSLDDINPRFLVLKRDP